MTATPTACRACLASPAKRMTPITAKVVATDAGPVRLAICPVCDRRRCEHCGTTERTGTAKVCRVCGTSLMLPAQF